MRLAPTDTAPTTEETGETATEETCKDCVEAWVTTQQLLGGSECEHGPEHDTSAACIAAKAAGAVPLCKEQGGACDCFVCRGIPYKNPFSIPCEGEILMYLAWCDLGNPNLTCETKAGGPGMTRILIEQTSTGGVCNGSHGSMVTSYLCGDPDGDGGFVLGACLATNCASTGGIGGTQMGNRKACT